MRTWLVALATLVAIGPATASADVVVLQATQDNTLYQTPAVSDLSNGAGQSIFSGRTGQLQGAIRRALVQFDIAGNLPAGATVNSVTLTLNLTKTAFTHGTQTVNVHRVTTEWGEGNSVAVNPGTGQEGGGTTPIAPDATWNFAKFNTDSWTTGGGDFVGAVSASQTVSSLGAYTWSGTGMVADVQDMLDNGGNFGWIVRGNEVDARSAEQWASRQNGTMGMRPSLTIDFTPPATAVVSARQPFVLAQAVPNPFNPTTTIAFDLTIAGNVDVRIYDTRGALVRQLASGAFPAGQSQIVWNGTNDAGRALGSGVYFVRAVSLGVEHTQKIVLIK